MIAPRQLPKHYQEWNFKHGAPFGHVIRGLRFKSKFMSKDQMERLRGPFGIQSNNTTRTFEYPWAFEAGQLSPGMSVLEVGGSLCGLQFVMDGFGCRVTNVDPGMAAKGVGWPCNQASITKLNAWFGSKVKLFNTTIENAHLEDNSFDRAFSISVLEHLTEQDLESVMSHVFRSLKPGGLFVLTVDLFLNLHPFCSRPANEYGKNQDVHQLIDSEKWELHIGNPAELFGFDAFDKDRILSNLDRYFIGNYPVLAQCVVLRKPIN